MRRSNLQRIGTPIARPAGQLAKALGVGSVGAVAVGSFALGAFAMGAVAIGAMAIGRLSIGKLHLRKARIDRLEVGTLVIDRQESESVPVPGPDSGDGGPDAQK